MGLSFYSAAMNDRQRKLHGTLLTLTNNDLAEVITEIKHLWPECWMVWGSPRHSQSNGGVERVIHTVQSKLGAWMTGNNTRRWSVGCRLMMWRYNTQQHRTVRDVPYRLVFGQQPHVEIAGLHLEQDLLDRLATEVNLNRVVEYEGIEEVLDDNDPGKVWWRWRMSMLLGRRRA
jgi:hypothetical protein